LAEVTLTIDGIQVTVPKGSTVLEAAQTAGIFIPTFCHDPELSKPGACRICVVEIPGMRNLPASCVTDVADGMVVQTASPAVIEARKMILTKTTPTITAFVSELLEESATITPSRKTTPSSCGI